ncbi:Radical SAM superfamily enzyme YgiQ, UPF0313 family [[Luteovulum] sphaeroides subsp. megalophilum]|uniref:B12-binding domain-containing radical SAM protein n=1 Tax=Cereibacter sphaeroides TaxID=1063 RepID=UPI000B65CEB2|nr:radical SAM protein [Cereibacter sphaeroides]SNT41244.1 Radical SAM superfamily enzyme YgiQ, UPF0313 family [[Luteovulum] sphaeroides subsp. megalophilum]
MLDVLLINPAAYSGTARRGPYELTAFKVSLVEAGIDAELLDLQEEVGAGAVPYPERYVETALARVRAFNARLHIITIRTTAGPWAYEIAKSLKATDARTRLIAYAPRIEERLRRVMASDDAFDALMLSTPSLDVATITAACLKFDKVWPPSVPGLLSREEIRRGGTLDCRPWRRDPSPRDYRTSASWRSADATIGAVHVGRGCPERCTFCAAPLGAGGIPRYATAADIVVAAQAIFEDLDPARRLFVMLETENLTSNRALIYEIAEERARRGTNFLWGCYGRIDHCDPAFQQVLRDAGCRFLFFGIETASPRLLKLIGKQYDPGIVLPRIAELQQAGITTQSSLMFGIPTETFEELLATVEMAAEIAWLGGFVDLTPLRIEAGTPMERLTAGDTTRLLRHGELYQDLKRAGVEPEACNPALGYRMFALESANYDIDRICGVMRRLRVAFVYWPMTAYILLKGAGFSPAELVEAASANSFSHSEGAAWLREMIASMPPAARAFADEMYRVEAELSGFDTAPRQDEQEFSISPLYWTVRDRAAMMPHIFGLDWWAAADACGGAAPTANSIWLRQRRCHG